VKSLDYGIVSTDTPIAKGYAEAVSLGS